MGKNIDDIRGMHISDVEIGERVTRTDPEGFLEEDLKSGFYLNGYSDGGYIDLERAKDGRGSKDPKNRVQVPYEEYQYGWKKVRPRGFLVGDFKVEPYSESQLNMFN